MRGRKSRPSGRAATGNRDGPCPDGVPPHAPAPIARRRAGPLRPIAARPQRQRAGQNLRCDHGAAQFRRGEHGPALYERGGVQQNRPGGWRLFAQRRLRRGGLRAMGKRAAYAAVGIDGAFALKTGRVVGKRGFGNRRFSGKRRAAGRGGLAGRCGRRLRRVRAFAAILGQNFAQFRREVFRPGRRDRLRAFFRRVSRRARGRRLAGALPRRFAGVF